MSLEFEVVAKPDETGIRGRRLGREEIRVDYLWSQFQRIAFHQHHAEIQVGDRQTLGVRIRLARVDLAVVVGIGPIGAAHPDECRGVRHADVQRLHVDVFRIGHIALHIHRNHRAPLERQPAGYVDEISDRQRGRRSRHTEQLVAAVIQANRVGQSRQLQPGRIEFSVVVIVMRFGRKTLGKIDHCIAGQRLMAAVDADTYVAGFQGDLRDAHEFDRVGMSRESVVMAEQRLPDNYAERHSCRLKTNCFIAGLTFIDLPIAVEIIPIRTIDAGKETDIGAGQRKHRSGTSRIAGKRGYYVNRLDAEVGEREFAPGICKPAQREGSGQRDGVEFKVVGIKLAERVVESLIGRLQECAAGQFPGDQLQSIRLLHDVEVKRATAESVKPASIRKRATQGIEGQDIESISGIRSEAARQLDFQRTVQRCRAAYLHLVVSGRRTDLDLKRTARLLRITVNAVCSDRARAAEYFSRADNDILAAGQKTARLEPLEQQLPSSQPHAI